MTPVFLAAAGVAAFAVALFLLRSLGPRVRLGRLLSAAPEVSIEEALELAHGPAVYVRVNGRVSSDEEFPDENDRPLVFRRTRIEVIAPGTVRGKTGRMGWRSLVDEREAVPFGIESRSAFLAIDEAVLSDGLVAIPRQAEGRVADLTPDLATAAAGLAADMPARLTIEQVSAVEHVTACGRPEMRDGKPILTAGLGRPLIVTSLDQPAAMRILASGARRRVAAAGILVATGLLLLALAAGAAVAGFALATPVQGASPTASPLPPDDMPVLIDPLDPRGGAEASQVGAPFLALVVVLGAGAAAAVAAIGYVRLTARRGSGRGTARR
ncbi:MAG: hypothetical protein ABI797_01340 [Chloroflexota bacterium]